MEIEELWTDLGVISIERGEEEAETAKETKKTVCVGGGRAQQAARSITEAGAERLARISGHQRGM